MSTSLSSSSGSTYKVDCAFDTLNCPQLLSLLFTLFVIMLSKLDLLRPFRAISPYLQRMISFINFILSLRKLHKKVLVKNLSKATFFAVPLYK